jgi:gamma-glutamyltranspeptidase/glutathione hydrolase
MNWSWNFPYPSQRMPVLARNVVATSQPLAAQAGLRMLLKGGNAVDAAIAAAITLTVVEPTSNGIGSDAFALIWDGQRLHGLNGSGRSPRVWTRERFAGLTEMPMYGWDAVTVPGAVDTWVKLSERFGRLSFAELFAPALDYADRGFPVSPRIAAQWAEAESLYRDFSAFGKTFLLDGRAPRAGEIFRCPDQTRTLQAIAETRGESLYRGDLAEQIVACARTAGGAMALEDLALHQAEWVEPIAVEYRGLSLHEIPPNGQGLAALIALGILRNHEVARYPVDSVDSIHLQIEAMKVAFAEAHRHIADPAAMAARVTDLLEPGFLHERSREIRLDRAAHPGSKVRSEGGTVYIAAADEGGMMVSFIQSNYCGFGSGIVIPGTGVSLQNRAYGFVLEEGHPNCVAGGKRPFHTIIPGFVTRDGRPLMSLGVMGRHMQPQGHVQITVRIFDYGQNPQAACDAPRWHVTADFTVALEPGFPPEVKAELRRRGHRCVESASTSLFGGAQIVYRQENGAYCSASDPRKDGQALGF